MGDYDTDILTWSETQGALLRRLAAGEQVNALVDWENVAEEVESVGREQLHAVESLLFQALVHMVKAQGWPDAVDAEKWKANARGFQSQARRRFVPSMRQKIDIAGIYADALKALPSVMDSKGPDTVAQICPLTLDELLTG